MHSPDKPEGVLAPLDDVAQNQSDHHDDIAMGCGSGLGQSLTGLTKGDLVGYYEPSRRICFPICAGAP
uniref:hypothetical protein n=1 Tax=Cupriavidus ulmosensis TaxID=3065913 RepID=UPI00296B09A8|nr:hypothetical protein [Cupriavidus sp. CV2]